MPHLLQRSENFTSRITVSSLYLFGTSIQLLHHEGLIQPQKQKPNGNEEEIFRLIIAGNAELFRLLKARIQSPMSDFGKLIVALKFRFLSLLTRNDQLVQFSMMIEICETELARHIDLRANKKNYAGHLTTWLDQEIDSIKDRLKWLRQFHAGLRHTQLTTEGAGHQSQIPQNQ